MANDSDKSIVFITGTFIGNNCWDEWKEYFESEDYHCIAPAWPSKDAAPEELRNRHPDNAIALNRLVILTDFFEAIINSLPDKPVLIGHSLGGLIVQLLIQRGLGKAGVVIHSFPPQGVNTFRFSLMKAAWNAMGFFTPGRKSYMISFTTWRYAITNGMTFDQQKELYYKYATPESKLLMRDLFKCDAVINFKKPHAPLLFISGSQDQLTHASLNYKNYREYKSEDSIREYKEFMGRNHLVFDQSRWWEEAHFIVHWLYRLERPNYML